MIASKTDPYQLIVESVRDYALLLLDASGHVTSWNPGAQAIMGYPAHEILGKHFSVFYPPEDRATKPANELAVASSIGRFEEEAWRIRKGGARFWANVVLTAVREDGRVVGFAKVTRDLTERKAAQEERERHLQAIRQLSTPILRLWPGVLLLPIVGDIDADRADRIMETSLERVVEEHAKIVIVDVQGVPAMSTYVADTILKTTAALRLVGARAVLTGVGAEMSRSMVRLGIDVSAMLTRNALADGLDLALSLLGKSVTSSAGT